MLAVSLVKAENKFSSLRA